MKTLFALTMFVAPVVAATALLDPLDGDFTAPKTVALPSMKSKSACSSAGGEWVRNACYFTTSDDVSVFRDDQGYDVIVSTVGADAKSCSFQSKGELRDDGTLHSTLATAVGPCELQINYAGDDWITVRSSGSCNSLCESDDVSLDIARARRVDNTGP